MTLVGAGNDYQKDLQFRKLNASKDVIDIKVGAEQGGGRQGGGNERLVGRGE